MVNRKSRSRTAEAAVYEGIAEFSYLLSRVVMSPYKVFVTLFGLCGQDSFQVLDSETSFFGSIFRRLTAQAIVPQSGTSKTQVIRKMQLCTSMARPWTYCSCTVPKRYLGAIAALT